VEQDQPEISDEVSGKRWSMENELPRIDQVKVEGPTSLRIRWKDKRATDTVNLAGWIATGGDILAPLKDPRVFMRAEVGSYGRAVEWDDGDLAIDAVHLKLLADEQRPFGNEELRKCQLILSLSNAEAADLVGVSPSTWASYRADANIPRSVAIVCRAAMRDPLLVQAYLRPRTAGRPRKDAS
jgi:hypothetical protein